MSLKLKFIFCLLVCATIAQSYAKKAPNDHHARSHRSKAVHEAHRNLKIHHYRSYLLQEDVEPTTTAPGLTPNEITYLSIVAVLAAVVLVLIGFMGAVTYRLRLYLRRATANKDVSGEENEAFDEEEKKFVIPAVEVTSLGNNEDSVRVDIH